MDINLTEITKKAVPIIKKLNIDIDMHTLAKFLVNYALADSEPKDYIQFSIFDITEDTLVTDLEEMLNNEVQKC